MASQLVLKFEPREHCVVTVHKSDEGHYQMGLKKTRGLVFELFSSWLHREPSLLQLADFVDDKLALIDAEEKIYALKAELQQCKVSDD